MLQNINKEKFVTINWFLLSAASMSSVLLVYGSDHGTSSTIAIFPVIRLYKLKLI